MLKTNQNEETTMAIDKNWEGYVKPFKIFGNLYFVGTEPASTHLIDTGDGLIVIDPGYPHTFEYVLCSMHELGFSEKDVKIIINTHGHIDHFGATKELVSLSGAKTYIGRPDADVANGKLPLSWANELGMEYTTAFEPDVLLDDGDVIKLGNTEILCKSAPGHTIGTMAFFFDVTDGKTTYKAAMHGGIGQNSMKNEYLLRYGLSLKTREMFTPAVMKFIDYPVDITLGNHCYNNDTVGKSLRMTKDFNPFIDKTEWKRFLQKTCAAIDEFIKKENEALKNA